MRKITIKSTGSQAPYGIGEIIDIVPARHWRKIQTIICHYYNPPTMHCGDCGTVVGWTYPYMDDNPDGIADCNYCSVNQKEDQNG